MKTPITQITAGQPAPKAKRASCKFEIEAKRSVAFVIFDRISRGEHLLDITSEDGMPHPNTVRNWAISDPTISGAYAAAQQYRLEHLLREIMELVDSPPAMCKDSRGNPRIDPSWVNLVKQRIETKRWLFTVLSSKAIPLNEDPEDIDLYPDIPMTSASSSFSSSPSFSPPVVPDPPSSSSSPSSSPPAAQPPLEPARKPPSSMHNDAEQNAEQQAGAGSASNNSPPSAPHSTPANKPPSPMHKITQQESQTTVLPEKGDPLGR